MPSASIVLGVIGLLSIAIVLVSGASTAAAISELYSFATAPSPYWVSAEAVRFYVAWPVLSVAAMAGFLAPGVLAVRAARDPGGFAGQLVLGFLVSLGLSIALPLLLWGVGLGGDRTAFLVGWAGLTVGAGAWSAVRGGVASTRVAPSGRRLILLASTWLLLSAALVPKLFWEDLSSDGVEAFEFGRSLLQGPLPSFDLHEGTFGFYQNFFVFAYVNHWFMQALGPFEVAARLPFLLYIGLTFATVVLIVEDGRARALRPVEELLLLAGVLLYGYVQAFSSTYEPFHTDLAEPSATDTLWTLGFLVAVWGLFAGRKVAFFAGALLCHGSSGGGLLLLLLLAAAVRVGDPELRPHFRWVLVAVGLALLVSLLHRVLYIEVLLDGVKDQLGGENLLKRLFPPRLFEFGRWNLLLFPSGLLPAVAMAWVRPRLHPRAFALALVTVGYFGVIYAQTWCGTHQFTPVMILPLVVFWRWYLAEPERTPKLLGALAVTTAIAFGASTPRHFQLSTGVRAVGLATEVRVGDYWNDLRTVAPLRDQFYSLLPQDYRILYPNQPWGADPYAWLHYAHRAKPEGQRIAYVVQRADAPAPGNPARTYPRDGFTTYVLDLETWAAQRNPGMPREVVPWIYEAPLLQSFAFFREVSGMEMPAEPQPLPLPD